MFSRGNPGVTHFGYKRQAPPDRGETFLFYKYHPFGILKFCCIELIIIDSSSQK